MGLLYIIISLLLNDNVHSIFEVMKSPKPLSWEKAELHCNSSKRNFNIAVPAVDFTTMKLIDTIALDGEAWVGYFKSYEYFLFIDCVPLSVINSVVYSQYSIGRTNNGPGMCYSLCGLQGYIGLQNGSCYCIDARSFSTTNTIPFNSSCMDPLHCGNGMLCGYQGHSNISVYKKVSLSSYVKGDGSGCLLVSKDNEYEMSVVNCSSDYRHLCEAQIGQTMYLEGSEEKQQWLYSIKTCGKTFKRPTTFLGDTTSYIFPNVSGSWWATVVRDLVIRNCSKTCTKIGSPLYEGYLKNSNDGIKLEFVHAENNSPKKSVACMSGETMKKSTSAKMVTAPEMTSSVPAKTIWIPTTSKATIVKDNEASTPGNKGTESRTISKEATSTMMSPTTPETTIASLTSGTKMDSNAENSTPYCHGIPLVSRTSESVRSVLESTVDLSVLLAVVGSFSSLLVASVLFNIYFIRNRRRIQIENTTELPYENPMAHEVERERYDTISGVINIELRSVPETQRNISTSTASYTSPLQDQDGYLTPMIAGANATYDYVK